MNMKKILLFTLSIIAFALVMTGCEDEEEIFYQGVLIKVYKLHYYPLDANYTGTLEVSKPSVTSLNILYGEKEVGAVTLTDGKGSFSIPKTEFPNQDVVGDKETLKFIVKGSEGDAARNLSVTLNNPLAVTAINNLEPKDTTIKIQFAIKDDCTAPTSVTMTRKINSGAAETLTLGGTMMLGYYDQVITPDMNKDTLLYTITTSNANGSVVATHQVIVAEQRTWDFEEYSSFATSFAPWVTVDKDELSTYTFNALTYEGSGNPASWIIFDYEATEPAEVAGWEAHSGTKFAMCAAAAPDGDLGNDDWMISKPFNIADGFTLSLWARSFTDSYGLERMIVKVFDVEKETETVLTTDPYQSVPTDWTNYQFDLSPFAGKQVKIMIGCVSYDAWALFVDDFEILDGSGSKIVANNFEKQVVNLDLRKFR